MAAPDAATAQYREQARITEAAVRACAAIWGQLNPTNVSNGWAAGIGDAMFVTLSNAQYLAAESADRYTDAMLLQQGITPPTPDGLVVPMSLAGVASDGRDLESLLLQPVITAAVARAGGGTLAQAMAAGLGALTRIVDTTVQDTGRTATGITVATRARTGYVRMVNPGACGRCAILAGRYYRWNSGFLRHPMCHCTNIPAREDTSDDFRTDPMAYFHSLSKEQQDKAFTVSGAQAIRDGADISKVVNARRGASGLSIPGAPAGARLQRDTVHGRQVATTTEGTGRAGRNGQRPKAPRLMPEAIYEIASDRADALRLLRLNGYIA